MGAVPIAAVSAVCAAGTSIEEVARNLFEGEGALAPVPSGVPVRAVCGAVSAPLPAPPPSLAAFDSRQARLALAGLSPEIRAAVERSVRRHGAGRVGIVVGSSTGGVAATENALSEPSPTDGLPPWFDYDRSHALGATLEVLRRATGAKGPMAVVSTACSSSGKALAAARRWIEAGFCDAVLAGGCDSLCRLTIRGFSALGVLSQGPCKPFSAERDGIHLGEASAFLLLDRAAEARGWLLGAGESSDAHHMSAPHPEGEGAVAAMRAALEDAGVAPEQVALVNAHGTGTKHNDAAEAKAIAAVLGTEVPVISTKGWTGHTLGAAGALEAVLTLLCLDRGAAPASRNARPLDPTLPCRVAAGPVALSRGAAAVSNSFAFGGSNVAVVLGGAR